MQNVDSICDDGKETHDVIEETLIFVDVKSVGRNVTSNNRISYCHFWSPTNCKYLTVLDLTHSVLRLFAGSYWSPITYTLLYTQLFNKTPVHVPILSVNWVYQLTWYTLSPMKWSNTCTANVQKIDVLMCLNARRLQAALGVQGMFLPTPVGGASIE